MLAKLMGVVALVVMVVGMACAPSPRALALQENAEALMKDLFLERLISVEVIEQEEDAMGVTVHFHAALPSIDSVLLYSYELGLMEHIKLLIEQSMINAYTELYQVDLGLREVTLVAHLDVSGPKSVPEDRIVYKTTMNSSTGATIDWENKARVNFQKLWVVDYMSDYYLGG